MNTQNTFMLWKIKEILILSPDLALFQPSLARLTLSRTNFHGPKGVRANEVRLYSGNSFIEYFKIT